ncbi:hypothetical protein D3C79_935860 [compost metagenome]
MVVSVKAELQEQFIEFMSTSGVEFSLLGTVTESPEMFIDGDSFGKVPSAKNVYDNVLHGYLGA